MAKQKINKEKSFQKQNQPIFDRILLIKRSMDLENPNPLDLHELGICYYHLQNYDKAISYLTKLLTKFHDYIEFGKANALQALCLIEKKEFLKAKNILENRIVIEKNNTKLLSMLAYVYEKLNKNDEAINILKKIIILEPQNNNALNSLGYLLSIFGTNKDRNLAMECLYKALKAHPLHPAYLDSLGVYYSMQGDYVKSYKAFTQAIKQAPDNSEILEHLQDNLERYKGTKKIILPK